MRAYCSFKQSMKKEIKNVLACSQLHLLALRLQIVAAGNRGQIARAYICAMVGPTFLSGYVARHSGQGEARTPLFLSKPLPFPLGCNVSPLAIGYSSFALQAGDGIRCLLGLQRGT